MPDTTFDLADITAAIEAKFKPIVIGLGPHGHSTLLPAGRLNDNKLDELFSMMGELSELMASMSQLQKAQKAAQEGNDPAALEGITSESIKKMKADAVSAIERIIGAVAQTDNDSERLVTACAHDLNVLMAVFSRYQQESNLGEASASSSSSDGTAGPSSTTSEQSTD